MCNKMRNILIIALTVISIVISLPLIAQKPNNLYTPEIDSIVRNTIDYLEIRNSLIQQQNEFHRKELQLDKTLTILNKHNESIVNEKKTIESELTAINRHLDSLVPPRPKEKRPKANIIDIINKGLHFNGDYGLNVNQLSLSNWAAGGENSFSGKAFANLYLVNSRERFEQKLTGKFAYGISRFIERKRTEKSDDKIDLTLTVTHIKRSKFNFSMVSTFNTQFADGYKYPNDSVRISGFMSPAYLTLSTGCTYRTLNDNFQVYMSPIAGKITFVTIQELADQGKYGVDPGYYTADSTWVPGKNIETAIGVNVIFNYKQPIGKNITYLTTLNCFYNYTEDRDDNWLKLDVNWENTLNFIISKSISTILFVHLKYDHNTTFPVYETIEGVETVVDNVPKLQFKESLGIAFVHRF